MEQIEQDSVSVVLNPQERVVVKEVLRFTLDEGLPEGFDESDTIESDLESHLEAIDGHERIHLQSGMASVYRDLCRAYAQELEWRVAEEDMTREMGDFFEGAFRSVVEKMECENATAI